MKRILCTSFCLLISMGIHAEQKLRVIDLGSDGPVSAEAEERSKQYRAAEDAAAKIPASEAMNFMQRLNRTVEQGHEQAKSGTMTGVQIRNQAIALNKLQDEGDRFGPIFSPFHTCNSAGISAARSWQGVVSGDTNQFVENHKAYLQAAMECIQAASS